MHGLISFFVSTDATLSDSSTCTVNGANLEIHASTTSVKLTSLDELRTAILELLGQPSGDGVVDTEKTIPGARSNGSDLVVKLSTSGLITIGSLSSWTAVKANELCVALVQYGLVTP